MERSVREAARVTSAFGLDFRDCLCVPAVRVVGIGAARKTLVIPHPSGLSREWNAPGTAQRVREAFVRLKELRGMGVPDRGGEEGCSVGQCALFGAG